MKKLIMFDNFKLLYGLPKDFKANNSNGFGCYIEFYNRFCRNVIKKDGLCRKVTEKDESN